MSKEPEEKVDAEMAVDAAHSARSKARERLRLAWSVAIIPNLLEAFGVPFEGGWLVVRVVLSTVFAVTFALWLVALWREHRPRRSTSR